MPEPFSYRPRRSRVAVIGGMMAYFETIMHAGFRDDLRAHVAKIVDPLRDRFDIVDLGLWADQGDAAGMRAQLLAAQCDVLVLVPTMATPPGEIAALASEVGLPVVIVCGHELSQVTPDYDMVALCRHSTNVGATMLGSMLRRLDPPIEPILVAGFLDDPAYHARIRLAVETAVLSRRLEGLRVGRLGAPMPGYDHLGLSLEEAAVSGIDVVDFALDKWTALVAGVSDAEIASALEASLPAMLPTQADYAQSPDLSRAMRLALALDRLADAEGLDCGAIACRGPFGVGLQDGAISCLATALLAMTGRPFSATGDIVTAIAMLIGRSLGRATLYCELDAIDRELDAFLFANTGEADMAWCADDGDLAIQDASVHSGRQVPGVVLSQDLATGPATMLGVTLDRTRSEKLSLIALEGHILEPSKTALNVTNGWFQTTHRPAVSAFEAWANASATHHGSLSPGHLAEATGWLGKLWGHPVSTISEKGAIHVS